jgi:DNA-binding NarL/FixJ family response regulator
MTGSIALGEAVGTMPTVSLIASDDVASRRLRGVVDSLGVPQVAEADADVLLLACSAFRQTEADTIRGLRRRQPDRAVLVVTRSGDAARVRLALEAGASGLLVDDEAPAALKAAVAAVAAGQLCLPQTYRRQVAKPTFTTREKQILGLVVLGLSNGEISRKLYLAESTVKSHLSSAFVKLGVRSRNEATAIIVDPASGLGPGILRISEDPRLAARHPR